MPYVKSIDSLVSLILAELEANPDCGKDFVAFKSTTKFIETYTQYRLSP